ncbi:DoxX family protein [Pelomonas sp. SE-A7]|uniref:DoxX family protein n=1 Tax=Pelomonas sp. SE-A7 TaxID=3054953 RepID=UPI00259C6FE6|nr:DoxX family protein [Pelomonas sp. SE-A7]MDM4766599.1 DoxX family protein [Pelomonas sp. SE-A7]
MIIDRLIPSLRTSLTLLRMGVAGLFLAHAITRVLNGTIPRFADFMGNKGFPFPLGVVWGITTVEIVCGLLVLLGYKARYSVLGLMAIAVGGIFVVHAPRGWFVGEHGSGGCEYSVCLLLCLIAVAGADKAGLYDKRGSIASF